MNSELNNHILGISGDNDTWRIHIELTENASETDALISTIFQIVTTGTPESIAQLFYGLTGTAEQKIVAEISQSFLKGPLLAGAQYSFETALSPITQKEEVVLTIVSEPSLFVG